MIKINLTGMIFVSLISFLGSQAFAVERQIAVSGTCKKLVTPDRGALTITIEYVDVDLKAATKKASDSYEQLRSEVKKLALEHSDLTTSEYSVNEVKEWEKNRNVFKGFRARLGLKVATSQTQRLGEVMAIASRIEAKEVGQLYVFLSDEKMKNESFECLQEAAENAKAKADRLAKSLGAKLGAVTSIQEGVGGSLPRPVISDSPMGILSKDSRDMSAPTVETGKQELSLSVQVVFDLVR